MVVQGSGHDRQPVEVHEPGAATTTWALQPRDPYCTPKVQETLQEHGWGLCSPRAEAGAPCAAGQHA